MPQDFGPYAYDKNGYCKRHPQIQLRKKRSLGLGWTTCRIRCPLCVFRDTTLTLTSSCSVAVAGYTRSKVEYAGAKGIAFTTHSLTGSRDFISHEDEIHKPDCSVCSVATSPTEDVSISRASSSRSSSSNQSTLSSSSDDRDPADVPDATILTVVSGATVAAESHPDQSESDENIACGMPYTIQQHGPGYYTGLLQDGKPHGIGTWRKSYGSIIIEGEWFQGLHLKSTSPWRVTNKQAQKQLDRLGILVVNDPSQQGHRLKDEKQSNGADCKEALHQSHKAACKPSKSSKPSKQSTKPHRRRSTDSKQSRSEIELDFQQFVRRYSSESSSPKREEENNTKNHQNHTETIKRTVENDRKKNHHGPSTQTKNDSKNHRHGLTSNENEKEHQSPKENHRRKKDKRPKSKSPKESNGTKRLSLPILLEVDDEQDHGSDHSSLSKESIGSADWDDPLDEAVRSMVEQCERKYLEKIRASC